MPWSGRKLIFWSNARMRMPSTKGHELFVLCLPPQAPLIDAVSFPPTHDYLGWAV